MRGAALLILAVLAAPSAWGDSVEDHPALKGLDLDGDNQISKAEAAGYATVTLGFDLADSNRDGQLSRAEWERYERMRARKEKKTRAAAKRDASASAGATPAKPRRD